MSRNNLNDLLALVAVARERSFTKAAVKLGVLSQPPPILSRLRLVGRSIAFSPDIVDLAKLQRDHYIVESDLAVQRLVGTTGEVYSGTLRHTTSTRCSQRSMSIWSAHYRSSVRWK
jgi:hypothetical protein